MYTYKYFDLKFENKISIKQRFPLLFSIKIYSSLVYCKLKLEMSCVLKSIVISLFSFSIAFTIVLNESFRCKKPCRWDLVFVFPSMKAHSQSLFSKIYNIHSKHWKLTENTYYLNTPDRFVYEKEKNIDILSSLQIITVPVAIKPFNLWICVDIDI